MKDSNKALGTSSRREALSLAYVECWPFRLLGQSFDFGAGVWTDVGEIGDFLAMYSSSDESVATVHPLTGVVTFVGPGTATITAKNGVLTAEAEIHVSE